MRNNEEIKKMIKLTGERAKLDAKANETYVVYKDTCGKLIKEYYNGTKEYLEKENPEHV